MTENTTKQQRRDTGDIMLGGYREDECFALTVTDDGFLPSIMPGDIVIVHKQPDVGDNELAVVSIDGDTNAILRRVCCHANGIMTLSVDNSTPTSNKRYEPILITAAERYRVHVFGKVISLMRDMQSDAVKRDLENARAADDDDE